MSVFARPVSVIIPAHNEEAVIGRCLRRLLVGAEDGELEVVVVCNGCSDSTAKVARAAAPQATIIGIPVASKVAALNAGDERANYFPRFYVDADVELPIASLRLTAQALSRPGVLCAAPSPFFALDARPWAVRAFYEVFQRTPYLVEGMVGTGVYALSDEGRRRFGSFPDLTADDQFVHQLFDRSQRSSVPGAHFVVHTPYKLGGLLRMRVRAYRGNHELARSGSARVAPPPTGLKRALALCLRPSFAPAAVVYLSVNLAARALARQAAPKRWERDESARSRADPGRHRERRAVPVARRRNGPCLLRDEPLPEAVAHLRHARSPGRAGGGAAGRDRFRAPG